MCVEVAFIFVRCGTIPDRNNVVKDAFASLVSRSSSQKESIHSVMDEITPLTVTSNNSSKEIIQQQTQEILYGVFLEEYLLYL